jgi:F420-dependent methylenetetrahydromethanopterin dehydrogenase
MQAGFKNTYDSIAAFSATDLTEDLKTFDRPTLIIHGDDDQVVPIDASARAAKKLVPRSIEGAVGVGWRTASRVLPGRWSPWRGMGAARPFVVVLNS